MNHRKLIIALIVCLVLILITPTLWRAYWHYRDDMILSKVGVIEKKLESYYQQYGYYPEENTLSDFSNQDNNSWIQYYNTDPITRQIFKFTYYLPSEGFLALLQVPFSFFPTPSHEASSCDTQGVCFTSNGGGITYYISDAPQQTPLFVFPANSDSRQGKIFINKLQALGFTHDDNIGQLYHRKFDVKDVRYDSNYFKSLNIFDDKYLGTKSEKIISILQATKEGETDLFYKMCDKNNKCFNVDIKVDIVGTRKNLPPRIEGTYYGDNTPFGIDSASIF